MDRVGGPGPTRRRPLTEVRLLGPGDEGVLANVAPDVFDDPIDAGAARVFLADARHQIAVAIDDGTVVGFVSAVHYIHPDKPRPEIWINEVGVAESHRRRGLARELIDAIVGRHASSAARKPGSSPTKRTTPRRRSTPRRGPSVVAATR